MTKFCLRLTIAACLLAGLAGCRADRVGLGRRPLLGDDTGSPCVDERCQDGNSGGARCAPCGTYQPTVWEPWHCGPMAMRGRGGEVSTESDPAWLNNLPIPAPTNGAKPQPETVPTPVPHAGGSSIPGLGKSRIVEPQADPAGQSPADRGLATNGGATAKPDADKDTAKPNLGTGFSLQPHAPRSQTADEAAKPAQPGLRIMETTPAQYEPASDASVPSTLNLVLPSSPSVD